MKRLKYVRKTEPKFQNFQSKYVYIYSVCLNMFINIIYKIYGVYMGSGRGGGADQKKKKKKKKMVYLKPKEQIFPNCLLILPLASIYTCGHASALQFYYLLQTDLFILLINHNRNEQSNCQSGTMRFYHS